MLRTVASDLGATGRRAGLAAAVLLGASLGGAATAQAAVPVTLSGGLLSVRDTDGTDQLMRIGSSGASLYTISDPRGGLGNNADPPCTASDDRFIRCPVSDVRALSVDLGGGAEDSLLVEDFGGVVNASGGDGADVLSIGPAFESFHLPLPAGSVLNGGADKDILRLDVLAGATEKGGGGNDALEGGPGDDVLNGGGGNDEINDDPTVLLGDGGGADKVTGGGGNDKVNTADGERDKSINCGPGKRDQATIDKNDPKPSGCEKVTKV